MRFLKGTNAHVSYSDANNKFLEIFGGLARSFVMALFYCHLTNVPSFTLLHYQIYKKVGPQ